MKAGSIVVVKPIGDTNPFTSFIKWLPVQDENTPYMIRAIGDFVGGKGVYFEEGVIGHYEGAELMLTIELVREILPPEDIAEQVEEMMCVPLNEEL